MEEKINIVELLKDCPIGMELYSPIFGNVYLEKIRPYLAVVVSTSDKQKKEFLYDGRYGVNGECMLFPSNENRDWSTFQRPFKDGDIVISNRGDIHLLRTANSSYCAYRERWKGLPKFDPTITTNVGVVRSATKEEKEKLFKAIKENGYRWNAEKKELERLIVPKFKVGDRIRHKLTGTIYKVLFVLSNGCGGGVYDVAITNDIGKSIDIKEQDSYELVPNKFNINTLKAFKSEVLVRHTDMGLWRPAIFGFISDNGFGVVGGNAYKQCIPYKGNEHLMGKFDDCDDFYKTWE